MSLSWRPFTPPRAFAALHAASMPSRIFWPSSLAAPLNGAEIPKRISLSVIPRTMTFGHEGSWPSGCPGEDKESCCPPEDACATVVGAGCATAAGAGWTLAAGACATGAGTGAATEADAGRVCEAAGSFGVLALSRSVDLGEPKHRYVASTHPCAAFG